MSSRNTFIHCHISLIVIFPSTYSVCNLSNTFLSCFACTCLHMVWFFKWLLKWMLFSLDDDSIWGLYINVKNGWNVTIWFGYVCLFLFANLVLIICSTFFISLLIKWVDLANHMLRYKTASIGNLKSLLLYFYQIWCQIYTRLLL